MLLMRFLARSARANRGTVFMPAVRTAAGFSGSLPPAYALITKPASVGTNRTLGSTPALMASQLAAKTPALDQFTSDLLDFNGSNSLPLENTAVVYVHHPLQTSVNLLLAMQKLGLDPKNTFVLGKHYSENPGVVSAFKGLGVNYIPCSAQIGYGDYNKAFEGDTVRMWDKVIENYKGAEIILCDHGGIARELIPPKILHKVVALEKTTSGTFNPTVRVPTIDVAGCAAKAYLESPLIAETVIEKLRGLMPIGAKQTCGVIGFGRIGQAVAAELRKLGHMVIVYDIDPEKTKNITDERIVPTQELSALTANAQTVFGCTGRDVTAGNLDTFLLSSDKTLVSASSGDYEFKELLKWYDAQLRGFAAKNKTKPEIPTPLTTIRFKNNVGSTITICRGGFPVNFDNTHESVPAKLIQITRMLVLAGVLQAKRILSDPSFYSNEFLALNPELQMHIVATWLRDYTEHNFPPELLEKFKDPEWIAENSNGVPCPTAGHFFTSTENNIALEKKPHPVAAKDAANDRVSTNSASFFTEKASADDTHPPARKARSFAFNNSV